MEKSKGKAIEARQTNSADLAKERMARQLLRVYARSKGVAKKGALEPATAAKHLPSYEKYTLRHKSPSKPFSNPWRQNAVNKPAMRTTSVSPARKTVSTSPIGKTTSGWMSGSTNSFRTAVGEPKGHKCPTPGLDRKPSPRLEVYGKFSPRRIEQSAMMFQHLSSDAHSRAQKSPREKPPAFAT